MSESRQSFCCLVTVAVLAFVFSAPVSATAMQAGGSGAQTSGANQPANQPPTPQPPQSPAQPPAQPAPKPQTNPIGAVATVKDNIAVEAGLLTSASATQLFGGWVAEHFLVVQVTISNQSREQQFILHDIFLDYSDWKLSGIYDSPGTTKSQGGRPVQDYQSATRRGQISSIGALEMQDALKQNSVFSKRNFFVNGLVMIGASAGGFTFLGPAGFTQGVAGYSSSFLPALQKFWPDRRIDQQSNLLKYGFQDKMVIAKEDPGKIYAFFPIERLLTSGLVGVYRRDPAVFLNMAELYLDPKLLSNSSTNRLKTSADELVLTEIESIRNQFQQDINLPGSPVNSGMQACTVSASASPTPGTTTPPGNFFCCHKYKKFSVEGTVATDLQCVGSSELNARVLHDLFSPCYQGGEEDCPLESSTADHVSNAPDKEQKEELEEIRRVKDVIAGLSLNTVRVVVDGIMTVDVQTIPAVLTKIDFENDQNAKTSIWEDTTNTHKGVIYGKYLSGGKPLISAIKVPAVDNPNVGNYIDLSSLTPLPDASTDSELHFSVKFKTKIPSGSVLTFQVSKTSNKSVNSASSANTQETTTSMTFDYNVIYPSVSKAAFDSPSKLLNAGTVTGEITGANLNGVALSVNSITPSPSSSPAVKVSDYVDGSPSVTQDPAGKDVKFSLKLKQGLPANSKVVLEVTLTPANGTAQTIDTDPITVPAQ